MSKSISAKATVPTRWVVESLSQIARHQDPLAKLQVMLDATLNFKKGKTLAATDATTESLAALFNIYFDLSRMGLKPWRLQSEQGQP
ncbi:hypothetical protein ABVK25_001416 [Lepraria finkii]|uniref:Uncharacterized protein n=1 Tax=Lepraria finkii TaxID=1340010 RepID=A0ABR4BNV9_9LECA